ncbi:DUF423 domain-containing protein [Marinibactrum halimedae]|uniref:Membrane protein n=1 Tax=Marinibactrum halimedae TaxID=1444977 RepID=A0AA37TDK5_9GAMM|nr:DUF423 domain-containing protein [Marinibactrum halimedae]MCD9458240.1 DUF423 domain-containing protein [Marinibactrum halimedae]GLS27132.1 membrane protein [Marinibactrum halimedae]
MGRWFLMIAAVNGVLAVCLGAFGAHALKDILSSQLLSAYQTAVQYQFYHLLALALVGVMASIPHKNENPLSLWISGWCFTVGIALFCGSLYGLALGAPRWIGPITPVGGLCFILGWVSLIYWLFRAKSIQ